MKKFFIVGLLLVGFVALMSAGLLQAQTGDTAKAFSELKTELQNKGMALKEITNIEKPVKEMLAKGATKGDLKKILLDLSGNGVKGKDLKNSVDAMNELVKSGEAPKQVGNIVSQAAHQALAQGIKGKDLAAKVHAAIKQRKLEKEQMKAKMKEQKMEMKGKPEKMSGKTKKGPEKQPMMQKGMGTMGGKGKK